MGCLLEHKYNTHSAQLTFCSPVTCQIFLQINFIIEKVQFRSLLLLYAALYSVSIFLEVSIIIVSLRGSVIDDKPRRRIRPLLYIKQGLLSLEIIFLCFSTKWLSDNAGSISYSQSSLLGGVIITDTVIIVILIMLTWCAWDTAGRDWVKLKKFQEKSQNTTARSERYDEWNLKPNQIIFQLKSHGRPLKCNL